MPVLGSRSKTIFQFKNNEPEALESRSEAPMEGYLKFPYQFVYLFTHQVYSLISFAEENFSHAGNRTWVAWFEANTLTTQPQQWQKQQKTWVLVPLMSKHWQGTIDPTNPYRKLGWKHRKQITHFHIVASFVRTALVEGPLIFVVC